MIRECFKCNTGLIFDAVMLQQAGLSIYADKYGSLALGELPDRVAAEPGDEQEHNRNSSSVAWSIVRGLWGAVTYPITYVRDIARMSRSHTKHAHLESKRHTLPVRSHGAEYRLMPFDATQAAKYEAGEEKADALSPLYDQLVANWVWRILEWIPVRVKKQKAIVKMEDGPNGYTWMYVTFPCLVLITFSLIRARSEYMGDDAQS